MNLEIANDVFHRFYGTELSEEKFTALLQRGIYLLSQNSNTDKLFISRYYKDEDLTAVNVALRYNEQLMIKLLME